MTREKRSMDDGPRIIPTDKVLCGGKFFRLVAACCRNCTEPQFCREFWDFFQKNGTTPQEYLRKFGLEEEGMKRIVFDCDRCGKKDIGDPLTIYYMDGENEGMRMTTPDFASVVEKAGKIPVSKDYLGDMLELLNRHEGWEHYCSSCFRKVVQSAVGILGPNAKSRRKAGADATMSAAGKALAAKSLPKPLTLEQEVPVPPPVGRKKTPTAP